MNLLIDPLPKYVTIGETEWPLRWDYRYWVMFELLILDSDISETDKLIQALELCFEWIPDDFEVAVEALLWFYRGGREATEKKRASTKEQERVYSFEHDDIYIYAAFLDQYGVDLQEVSLHWWKFRAMFRALKSDNEFVKIMGYRTMKIDPKLDDRQKAFYREMKELYTLPLPKSEQEKLDSITAALAGDGNVDLILNGGGAD